MHRIFDEIPSPGDPRIENPLRYVDRVRARNKNLLARVGILMDKLHIPHFLRELLNSKAEDPLQVHIATPGSDGREEKKGDKTSPLEAIVLIKRQPGVARIENEVKIHCLEAIRWLDIFGGIEIKDLDLDKAAYCQDYAPPTPWPTIIIDALPLGNVNSELVRLSKELLFQDMQGSDGKSVTKALHKRFAEYRQVAREGENLFKGQKVKHFNPITGELFYNPKGTIKQGSVKFGPLRTVQMFLAHRILQFIRSNTKDKTFLHQVPANTEEKVAALLDAGALKLSTKDAEELVQLYKYFLWCFYISEYVYGQNENNKIVVVPDVQLFRENLTNLLKLVKLEDRS